ncbi:hypothetical protein Tco_0738700 [Tanacetum coccineum]
MLDSGNSCQNLSILKTTVSASFNTSEVQSLVISTLKFINCSINWCLAYEHCRLSVVKLLSSNQAGRVTTLAMARFLNYRGATSIYILCIKTTPCSRGKECLFPSANALLSDLFLPRWLFRNALLVVNKDEVRQKAKRPELRW